MDRRDVRLAAEIQHAVMELIPYGLKDPRVETVSVTSVQVTHDLKLAKIRIDVPGDAVTRQRALRALRNARGYLRRELAAQVTVRQVPDLAFYLDMSRENQRRVETLLDEIHFKKTS